MGISLDYENELYSRNYAYVAGVDEAGRGPLAGPAAACAVVMPRGLIIEGVDDSKKLSEKKREALAVEIKKNALAIGVGLVDAETIDEINILQATFEAMRKAINALVSSFESRLPDYCLIDGSMQIPGLEIPQKTIIGGDSLCFSIAAASIIAKTQRDKIMREYHEIYPEYGFINHKGYGTKKHYEALAKYGPCPIHRKSFLKKFFEL